MLLLLLWLVVHLSADDAAVHLMLMLHLELRERGGVVQLVEGPMRGSERTGQRARVERMCAAR